MHQINTDNLDTVPPCYEDAQQTALGKEEDDEDEDKDKDHIERKGKRNRIDCTHTENT